MWCQEAGEPRGEDLGGLFQHHPNVDLWRAWDDLMRDDGSDDPDCKTSGINDQMLEVLAN